MNNWFWQRMKSAARARVTPTREQFKARALLISLFSYTRVPNKIWETAHNGGFSVRRGEANVRIMEKGFTLLAPGWINVESWKRITKMKMRRKKKKNHAGWKLKCTRWLTRMMHFRIEPLVLLLEMGFFALNHEIFMPRVHDESQAKAFFNSLMGFF